MVVLIKQIKDADFELIIIIIEDNFETHEPFVDFSIEHFVLLYFVLNSFL